jgi:hypothetical protein
MVGLRDTGIILVRHGVPYVQFEGVFYMPTGACSRGYKLRSREGEYPKSVSVAVSCECSVCVCVHEVGLYDRATIGASDRERWRDSRTGGATAGGS